MYNTEGLGRHTDRREALAWHTLFGTGGSSVSSLVCTAQDSEYCDYEYFGMGTMFFGTGGRYVMDYDSDSSTWATDNDVYHAFSLWYSFPLGTPPGSGSHF